MTKKLMIGTAIAALMVSGALAQAPNAPASSSASPPAASSSSPPAAKSMPADSASVASKDQANSGKAEFVMSQKPDQWLASKFKGTDVLGSDDQKIGDVSDILFDKSGKVEAFVISVGGILGMGGKEVALAPSSFDTVPAANGGAPKLKLSMTKDQLKNAQNFARYQPPHPTTTGSGAGLNTLPGAGSRPSSNTPSASR